MWMATSGVHRMKRQSSLTAKALASVAAATAAGALIGWAVARCGQLVTLDQRSQLVLVFAGALIVSPLLRVRLPQRDVETPQALLSRGPLQWAVGNGALLGLGAQAELDIDNRPSHHELEGETEHDHDEFESFVVPIEMEIGNRSAFLERVRKTVVTHEILRLKGFLAVHNLPSRLLVQAVGPRLEAYFDRPWRRDEPRSGNLVVIGLKGLDQQAIAADLRG